MSERENVRVVIRCRPFSKKEIENKYNSCVKLDLKRAAIAIQNSNNSDPKAFTFDGVFDGETTQVCIKLQESDIYIG